VFESIDSMTPSEFAGWVERASLAPGRYELLNGRVVMTPPASYPHGGVGATLVRAIGNHVEASASGRVFDASQGFELPSGDTVEPDVTFISHARWIQGPPPEEGRFLRIVPDLVVEVLSPATASRDRGEKKAIYERNAVGEYWLVDVRARRVIRFVLVDGRFDAGTSFEEDAALESTVLPGFSAAIADLMRR
jgi:Uma2 family endonuclease